MDGLQEPFEVQRGIRQGCPLSALLFLLVVEILGDRIRKNTHDGLEINFKNQKKNYPSHTVSG